MVMRIDLYNMKVLTYVLYNILLRMPGLMKKALEDQNIVPAYHIPYIETLPPYIFYRKT